MKKKILTAMIIAVAVALTACGNSETDTKQASADNSAIQSELESLKAENEALMSEMSDMQTTVETEATTTVEETTTETTISEVTDNSPWKISYYVDDFGRETESCFIYGETQGTFSNSATSNSKLVVSFLIDRYLDYNDEISDSVQIILFEYGSNAVNNFYSEGKIYDIQVLEENDNVVYEEGWLGSKGDRIYVWGDKDQNSIINAIKNNDTLTFRIDEQDGFSSYIFDVDCTGFKELFESIDWNV